ncbi:MAG: 3-methyladenine DNA glycosylase [Campylobacteraceae bacterium]|jgi:endonuclease-3 related protein|nr:3-methyladenine DNA glycosylase [Campylobacteraceae bacterium]
MNSFDLLVSLKNAGYLKSGCEKFWWPNAGSFEIVVGSVLTQQTKWSNVAISLKNLEERSLLSLEALSKTDEYLLKTLIQKCGFSGQKASRLIMLSRNIIDDFGDFETFRKKVEKEWLLKQKGLGHESADAILCYACFRPVMVIDSYTNRLLRHFGYEFGSYEESQEWFYEGVLSLWNKTLKLYDNDIDEMTLWARYHGKIVEFCKENMNGKNDISSILNI